MSLLLPQLRFARVNRRWVMRALGSALLLLAGCSTVGDVRSSTPPAATPSTPAGAAPATSSSPAATGSDLIGAAAVVKLVKPAVVQITNEQLQGGTLLPAGVGSGVIYDQQGHIFTNNHVVEGAQRLTVALPDGRSFEGRLVGRDSATDLAVLQISGEGLPVAAIGDSTKLDVGQFVIAIGNALALPGGPTVTLGVVSAVGRAVQEPASGTGAAGPYLFDLIQTDASINPGNSGGPLVDLAGRVVGLSTLAGGEAGAGLQAQGIGFAIGTETMKRIGAQLVSEGRATHPWLGVRYVPLNAIIAAQLGIAQTKGVLVEEAQAGGPATAAGLRASDIISRIDGQPLTTESSFAESLDRHRPGDRLRLTVIRGGQTTEVDVTLGTASVP